MYLLTATLLVDNLTFIHSGLRTKLQQIFNYLIFVDQDFSWKLDNIYCKTMAG